MFEPEHSAARKRPRQQRALNTIVRIQRAMLQIIDEEGYAAASTNRIAQRAEVNIGSVYQYFPNRLAIAQSIYEETSSRFGQLMRERILAGIGTPLEDTVRTLVDTLVDFVERERVALLQLVDQVPELRRNAGSMALENLAYSSSRVFIEQHLDNVPEQAIVHKLYIVQHLSMELIRCYVQDHPPSLGRAEFVDHVTHLIVTQLRRDVPANRSRSRARLRTGTDG